MNKIKMITFVKGCLLYMIATVLLLIGLLLTRTFNYDGHTVWAVIGLVFALAVYWTLKDDEK